MDHLGLSYDMMVILAILGLTVFLFVSEIVRIDLAAICIMLLLGVLSYAPGLSALADVAHLFDGFSSNAVISIIAVMILGAGLDKTGVMGYLAGTILRYGGRQERRLVVILSGAVASLSSFMQNVGAVALFLPVVSRVSAQTGITMRRLLLPVGFCTILGGNITMVGSSPLILLNDLIDTANGDLPPAEQMEEFGLFAVAPVGLALVLIGILFFAFLNPILLPQDEAQASGSQAQSMKAYLKRLYGLQADLVEVVVPANNLLVGETLGDLMEAHHFYVIGTYYNGQRVIAPTLDTEILAPCRLAILGHQDVIKELEDIYGIELRPKLEVFAEEFSPVKAGVAEIVVPPGSNLIGGTARDLSFRRSHGLSLLAIYRGEEVMSHVETEDHPSTRIGLVPLKAGDTLVVHTSWARLTRLTRNRDFVIVTSDFPQEELRPQKLGYAVAFFLLAISLILLTDMRLSLCLFLGAAGMVLSKVLSMEEAYSAVGWNSVFLLAALIPLGSAVEATGTAAWIAALIGVHLGDWPIWALQFGIGVLATAFTLVMSNVGSTVLLVPIAISIARVSGGDPAAFALIVALATSNSFLIPTHQVNALIMGPGGYSVRDFLRVGGVMTLIYLVVIVGVVGLIF